MVKIKCILNVFIQRLKDNDNGLMDGSGQELAAGMNCDLRNSEPGHKFLPTLRG